jgi:hypothetical protein
LNKTSVKQKFSFSEITLNAYLRYKRIKQEVTFQIKSHFFALFHTKKPPFAQKEASN